jgi:Flp pilus assembly protein TadD
MGFSTMRTNFKVCVAALAMSCTVAGCESGRSHKPPLQEAVPYGLTGRGAFSSADEALSLADSLKAAGAHDEALGVLASAYERYPGNSRIASAYGRLALAFGEERLAAPVLESALAGDPADWRALSAQAVLDGKNGHIAKARTALRKAEALSDGDPAVLNNLGVSHLLLGDASEAAGLFRRAIASRTLNPAHAARIKRNLAIALAVGGDFEAADRLAGEPLPRNLKGAGGNAVAAFMGLGAEPEAAGWSAHLGAISPETAPPSR